MNLPGNDIPPARPSWLPAQDGGGDTQFLNKYGLAILGAVSVALLLIGLGSASLCDSAYDQAMYAEVTRNMVNSGEYFRLTFRDEPYSNKPPLLFWMIAGFSKLTGGVDETAGRLPSALAGVGAVLLTFVFGRRLFGSRIAFIASIVLLTAPYFVERARSAHMDTPLVFFMLLMIIIFHYAQEKRKASSGAGEQAGVRPLPSLRSSLASDPLALGKGDSSWWAWPAFFLLGALGTLLKGPVGLLLPLAICLLLSWTTRNWRAWDRTIAWGAATYAVVVGGWLLLVWRHAGTDYLLDLLIRQNVGRATGLGLASNPEPIYFHFVTFSEMFVQWTPLLVLALIMAGVRFRRGERDRRLWFLAAWIALIFVVFTIVVSKHRAYTLPAFPAAAILVAWMFDLFIDGKGERRIGQIVRWGCGIMLGAVAAGVVFLSIFIVLGKFTLISKHAKTIIMVQELGKHPASSAGAILIGAVVVAAGVIGALSALQKRWRGVIASALAVCLTFHVFYYFIYLPPYDMMFKSPKTFAAAVNREADGAEVAVAVRVPEHLMFYLNRKYQYIGDEAKLPAYLAESGPEARYCVMLEEQWSNLKKNGGGSNAVEVYRDTLDGHKVVIVRSGGR